MKKRIYVVNTGVGSNHLVRAANRHQALSHVARATMAVEVATQDDLVDLLSVGVKVQETSYEQEDMFQEAA